MSCSRFPFAQHVEFKEALSLAVFDENQSSSRIVMKLANMSPVFVINSFEKKLLLYEHEKLSRYQFEVH